MENVEARIYSRWDGESIYGASQTGTDSTSLSYFHFDQRAYDSGSISLAADRFDFAKFIDVHNNYFGRYSALVDQDVSPDEEQIPQSGRLV